MRRRACVVNFQVGRVASRAKSLSLGSILCARGAVAMSTDLVMPRQNRTLSVRLCQTVRASELKSHELWMLNEALSVITQLHCFAFTLKRRNQHFCFGFCPNKNFTWLTYNWILGPYYLIKGIFFECNNFFGYANEKRLKNKSYFFVKKHNKYS